MAAERLHEDPPVLAEGLAMAAVVLTLHDREEPAKLLDRGPETVVLESEGAPRTILRKRASVTRKGGGTGSGRVNLDRLGEIVDGAADLLEAVSFEPDEAEAETIEPVEERVEIGRSVRPEGGLGGAHAGARCRPEKGSRRHSWTVVPPRSRRRRCEIEGAWDHEGAPLHDGDGGTVGARGERTPRRMRARRSR